MIFITIVLFYCLLIGVFIIGFNNFNSTNNKLNTATNTFSICIPFRNEAHNLPILLNSLYNLNYPTSLFEIILINDDSTDNFEQIIESFKLQNTAINLKLITNKRKTNSPKKDALNYAVEIANYNWIITTDADCIVPVNWLLQFNAFIKKEAVLFISAPVQFKPQNSFLHHFQNLNFISLMGSTIGAFGIKKPFMCNGANLCYSKNTFLELNGFNGNETIASGDDIFLLEKMIEKHASKTKFLKHTEVIVTTTSEKTWKSFINQQIRWASKSTAYKNNFAKIVSVVVFTTNVAALILGILAIVLPFYWQYLLLFFFLKISIDFILIFKTSLFLKNYKSLPFYLTTSLLYPFYIIIVSSLSLFKKYEWKGRLFSK